MTSAQPSPLPVVYILRCRDGSLYTGAAKNLEQRLQKHHSGKASKYTRSRLPVRLAFTESCSDYPHALRREAELKKMPRKKKELLIKNHPLSS